LESIEKVKFECWIDETTFFSSGGCKYIDLTSGGIFAGILGGNPESIRKAMDMSDAVCAYGAHLKNVWAEMLKAELCEWTGFEACALFSTGSEATEAWWRACRHFTGKPGVWGGFADPDNVGKDVAPPDAMHGHTLGAKIMAGKVSEAMLMGNRFGQSHETTSCAIWEPYHAPSAQFHREQPTIDRIRELIEKIPNLPHCSDEIQAGLGRTGKLFGYQWYDDLKPAAVTLGKALGGGLPVSALLGSKEIVEDFYEDAQLHSTHSDNPIMAAAALAVIREIRDRDLIKRSYELGRYMDNLTDNWLVRVHGGRGLLMGIELADTIQADLVVQACRRRGVWVVHTGRKWVKLGPAFVIRATDLEEGMARVGAAIEEVLENDDPETRRDTGEEPGGSDSAISDVRVQRISADGEAESSEDDGPGGADD
jgi:putrescine aminotransferase